MMNLLWEITPSSCSGRLRYNRLSRNIFSLFTMRRPSLLTSGVEFFGSTSVTSRTLASNWVAISMSLTGVRLDLLLQQNVVVYFLSQLMLHLHLRKLFVDGHDLGFVELVHSHLRIEANFGTNSLGHVGANAEYVTGKTKMYKLVMLDSFTEDVDNHGWRLI